MQLLLNSYTTLTQVIARAFSVLHESFVMIKITFNVEKTFDFLFT